MIHKMNPCTSEALNISSKIFYFWKDLLFKVYPNFYKIECEAAILLRIQQKDFLQDF